MNSDIEGEISQRIDRLFQNTIDKIILKGPLAIKYNTRESSYYFVIRVHDI